MLSKEREENIDSVYKYFLDEAKRRRPRIAITKSIDRTAAALKLPKSTFFFFFFFFFHITENGDER